LDHYKKVVWTLILGAVFLAYQGHTLASGHFAGGRLDSLGGIDFREANGFAAFLAAAVTFAGVQMLRVSWWKKVLYIAGIALMLNAIIMTQSRAVFLGILMAVPYVLLRTPSERRKQVYACAALGMVLFFMLADVKFLGRMETIKEAAKSGVEYGTEETLSRWDFWKASLPMFIDHPFGVGIKNFEKLVPYYDPRNTGMDAHNTYVLCYSEIGILGITLFLIIIVEGWRQLGRIRKMAAGTLHERDINLHVFTLGIVLIIYFLGYMTTHSMLYAEIVWILLSMPICLENATRKLLEAEKIEDEKLGSGEGGLLEDK
jgi:putative inorganic carbon (HCO3(-)) transporter